MNKLHPGIAVLAFAGLLFGCLSAASAQVPLCDDGMGAPKKCGSVGSGGGPLGAVIMAGPSVGAGSGPMQARPIQKIDLPGIKLDLSKSAMPMLETTGALWPTPYEIGRFQGAFGTYNRWYVGHYGMYFAFNASTTNGLTWTRDVVAQPSSVLVIQADSKLRWMYDGSASLTWTTANPERSIQWVAGEPTWSTSATATNPITAWAGGSVKGAKAGDVLQFAVQFPQRFDNVPSTFAIGADASSGIVGTPYMSGVIDSGGILNLPVLADGDVTWVGHVRVSN